MDKVDWFVVIGYAVVGLAFSVTLYVSITGVTEKRHGKAYVHERRWGYNLLAALIAAAWPISLPIAVVLATAAIMAGHKR